MAIRSSSAGEVERLVARLTDPAPMEREAAIARLRVIGARATERLTALLTPDTAPDIQAAALRALEENLEPRVRELALAALDSPSEAVALAAAAVLRPWLGREDGLGVLEQATAAVLDERRPAAVRALLLEGLQELGAEVTGPLLEHVSAVQPPAPVDDAAAAALDWLEANPDAPLSQLADLVTRARTREDAAGSPEQRRAWQQVRGATHLHLSKRESRVALYDLREAFERVGTGAAGAAGAAGGALPIDYVTAMTALGDASCLDALGHAWGASEADAWWRERLDEAARAIVAREKITGRNAALKKVRARWPGFLA